MSHNSEACRSYILISFAKILTDVQGSKCLGRRPLGNVRIVTQNDVNTRSFPETATPMIINLGSIVTMFVTHFPGHSALPTKPGSSVGGSVQQRGEYRGASNMEKQEGKPWRETRWGPMRWWFWVLVWGGHKIMVSWLWWCCPSSYLDFLQLGFLRGHKVEVRTPFKGKLWISNKSVRSQKMNSCCSVSSFKVLKRGQIEHELEEKENPESIHSWHPPYVRCLLRVWCIASYFVRPCFRDAGGAGTWCFDREAGGASRNKKNMITIAVTNRGT